MEKLHIVTCISNPVRWQSRYKLYREFEKRMLSEPNVELWTAELAFDDRPFEVTSADNSHHLQLRSIHELWHKENLLNLLVQRLPDDGNPVAFIDADVAFIRPDWVAETLQQLKHYSVVQMFSEAIDLGSDYQRTAGENRRGIVAQYFDGVAVAQKSNEEGYNISQGGHPGYAWAWRRDALNAVGGLIDFSILGSADWQMACGLLGEIENSVNYPVSPSYLEHLKSWGERAKKLRRNIGYVETLLIHYWHGPKSKRGYDWRTKILSRSMYDPHRDIHRDVQGLWQLNDEGSQRSITLRDDLRHYFRSRNEDLPS